MFVMVSKRLHFSGCAQTKARESFFLRLSLEALWLKLLFVLQIFASPKDVFLCSLFFLCTSTTNFRDLFREFFFLFSEKSGQLQITNETTEKKGIECSLRHFDTHKKNCMKLTQKTRTNHVSPAGVIDGRKEIQLNSRQNKQQKCLVNFKTQVAKRKKIIRWWLTFGHRNRIKKNQKIFTGRHKHSQLTRSVVS